MPRIQELLLYRMGRPLTPHLHPGALPFNQLWMDHQCNRIAFTSHTTCRNNKNKRLRKLALFFSCISLLVTVLDKKKYNGYNNLRISVSYDTTFLHITHNRLQSKHGKIFHRRRVLWLYTVQKELKTYWNLRGLHLTRFGRCAPPWLYSLDRTGLDWTRLDSVVGYAPLEPLNYSYSTTNKMHLLSQIIYSCKTLYMFRTVFPSIIRSPKLRIQQRFISNSRCYLLLSEMKSSSVSSPTAVWHIPLLYTQFWAPDDGRKDRPNSCCYLLLSGMRWSSVSSPIAVWHIPLLYTQFWTPDDRRKDRPKHVERFTRINHLR
jgi:hypothetical protein